MVAFADLSCSMGSGPEETITPMRFASVIALDKNGKRKAVGMRWGLVPPGTRDSMAVKPHIHARAETIDTKPTFRDAFRLRRGIVAVSSFNEGREITPTKTEQHVLTPKDGEPIAIGVVWEHWRKPDGGGLLSFAMVTVPACPRIATITDRMPSLLAAEDWAVWLGETPAGLEEIKALLRPSERALDMAVATKRSQKIDQPDLF